MDMMTYQMQSSSTAIYPDNGRGTVNALTYVALGLAGEAGEVANKVKKILRDNVSFDEARVAIAGEIGDVLWYVAQLATELDIMLDDVAVENIKKLQDRKSRGVIGGSGDTR